MNELHELDNIHIESGVSAFDGSPFCRITCRSTKGDLMSGQLPPNEIRLMALSWLEAAESSEHDAGVFTLLKDKLDADDETAAMFLQALREGRKKD